MIENVLAQRYASPEMRDIWDPTEKVRLERRLWLAVLSAQRRLGLDVESHVIDAYQEVLDQIDLKSIGARERALRHDVKARIEEFNSLAGHEAIHLGMTSRDLTENVEQLQVRQSLEVILIRAVAALASTADMAACYADLPVTGRTHNVPAQVTTVGKRLASAGEELLIAIERVEHLVERYPLRGVKGPVGTQQDQTELLGSPEASQQLDREVAEWLGFTEVLGAVGQVYPRSLDLEVVSALSQVVAGPVNLTTTLRLMAGHDLATEGFRPGQVGSSAMPHKTNARTSERVHGLKVVLAGHLAMAASLSGEQWNEGDVACSVVRRVMLPDAFFATDGLFQSFLSVVAELGFHQAPIAAELEANLPFLATSRLLLAAVGEGMGREQAHEIIGRHSLAAALERRERPHSANDLLARLSSDPDFPLDQTAIAAAVGAAMDFTGLAAHQVALFVERAAAVVDRHPEAVGYRPESSL